MSDYLYILYSPTIDHYYIGTSTNVERRLEYHNRARKGWTVRGRPWQLVFKKEFSNRQEAFCWERWLKAQKSRVIIERMIRKEFDWKNSE